MIINRNSELEKNMYAKLSQVDELISSNDVYALGLRLNALSSLCKALREDSAVKALTEALDKVIESGIIDSIDKNSLKHFMIGNAFYTASDFTGDDKYKNEAVKLAAGFKNFARNNDQQRSFNILNELERIKKNNIPFYDEFVLKNNVLFSIVRIDKGNEIDGIRKICIQITKNTNRPCSDFMTA